jgi:hypothetical protein
MKDSEENIAKAIMNYDKRVTEDMALVKHSLKESMNTLDS